MKDHLSLILGLSLGLGLLGLGLLGLSLILGLCIGIGLFGIFDKEKIN
jgi:hypothetical protein